MMIARLAIAMLGAAALATCAQPHVAADSTTVLTVDTLKPGNFGTAVPAPDTVRAAGTGGAAASGGSVKPISSESKTSRASKTTGTKTKQGATTGTKELGRDSIIRIDTKDKRRQIPPIDSTLQG